MLNWQTDPIYFDSELKPVNQWINANELISSNRKNAIFLDGTSTFNLYPILVRRVDFLRENQADRILARFPYVPIAEQEKESIIKKELLIAEKLRDYFYKSDNRSILEWRDTLRNDLKRGVVPLPFLRCFPEEVKINFQNRVLSSARGETFIMPLQLTEEIAYLCGVVDGDGSLSKYVLNIVDFSLENIRQLKKRFERLFQQSGRIQLQRENSPTLIITNLWVVRLFSFLTDHPIGGKKYDSLHEPLLFHEQPLRSYYWSGAMDTDGSYSHGNITFTSASLKYAHDFISFLGTYEIRAKLTEREDNTYRVYIPRKFYDTYKLIMKCFHPEKKEQFHCLKNGKEKKSKKSKYFKSFNSEKMLNGFFDFTKLPGLQIIGLGNYIKNVRKNKTQIEFAVDLQISSIYLNYLETERNAISIPILVKILDLEKKELMPLLLQYKKNIKYRRLSAPFASLDLKPNNSLLYFAKKMIFYNNYIRIVSQNKNIIQQIETHFGIKVKNEMITNGTIRYYFKMLSNLIEDPSFI